MGQDGVTPGSADPVVYGKYQLLELLARGGMAEVFKAKSHGVEGFEKILVIKRILPELSCNPQFVEMFINEAKIAVTLSHANIVHVFDLGRAEDSYFIAMEYVAGMDLATLNRRCAAARIPIPVEMAVAIVSEVAKALDYAHRRRGSDLEPLHIVHRDVSPHNVLISYEGEVKLTDFGIARARTTVDDEEGVLKGKYAYMSPEQARGERVDSRMDIFAIGTVLYELLSGKNPFASGSNYETLKRVREGTCRPLCEEEQGVPKELSTVVATAMHPDPEQRFQDAGKLYEALIQYLFATGRRVGPHDIGRFLDHLRVRTHDAEGDASSSVLRAAFASDSEVQEIADADKTPVEVPDPVRRSAESTSGVSRPEKEWREVTLLAARFPAKAALPMDAVLELLKRFGGVELSGPEAEDGASERWWTAVFGAENPDGYDSEAAVRFAWRLHRLLRMPSADEHERPSVEVGVGIQVGRVLFDVFGTMQREEECDALLEEARQVAASAPPNAIMLTSAAERPVRGLFEFSEGPADGFIVKAERSQTDTVGRFVGRRDELKRIGELLAIANSGRQRVIVLEGEAGSGKSRVLLETGRRLTLGGHDVGMYVARLSPQGRDTPLSAMSEMLHVILGIDEFDPEAVAQEKVARLRELGLSEADMGAVASTIGLTVDGDYSGARRLLLAVGRIVTRLAEDRLTVFAFDGVESMDDATAETLDRLIRESRTARVAVLLTHRPGPVHAWGDCPGYSAIRLGPMEDDDIARLTAARLQVEEVPMKLLRAVTIKSGGNPLYVEEHLKALADAGAIEVTEDVLVYHPDVAAVQVPKTLRGIIGARLARLDPLERYLLQILSVLGRGGTAPLIAHIAGETTERTTQALRGLEGDDFVAREGSSEYRFAHAVMGDVIREGLTIEALKAINLAAGLALESLFASFREEMAEKLAQHFRQAGNRDKAVAYREVAAERCVGEFAFDLGILNLEKAIELIRGAPTPQTEHLLKLYRRIGELCWRSRAESKGIELMTAALELAEGVGRSQYIAAFSVLMGRLLASANRFAEAQHWLERGQQLARSLQDTDLLRDATLGLSDVHTRNGKYRRAIAPLLDGLQIAIDTGDTRAEFQCRMNLALAYAGGGEREESREHFEAGAEFVAKTGDRFDEVRLLKTETVLGHFYHDHELTIRSGLKGVELSKEYGFSYDASAIAHNLGESYLRTGDYKRAFASLKYSYDVAVEHGFLRMEYTNLRVLGFIDVMRFGSPEGRERVKEACAFAKEQGYLWDELQGLHFLALVEHALGNTEAAKSGFREVIRLSGEYGNRQYEQDAEAALVALESGEDVPMPS